MINLVAYTKSTYVWLKNSVLFFIFLNKHFYSNIDENVSDKNTSCVIIQPWLLSAVPFYTMLMGIFLKKKGRKIDFIFDLNYVGNEYYYFLLQKRVLIFFSWFFRKKISIIKSTDFPNNYSETLSESILVKNATNSTIHFFKGEMIQEGRVEYYNLIYSQLKYASKFVLYLLNSKNYEYIYVPGGVRNTSCLYVEIAKEKNIRVVTFDSDFGVKITSINGIAAHLTDIPTSFDLIKNKISDKEISEVKKNVDLDISKRMNGTDHFRTQVDNTNNDESEAEIDIGVLILLNVSWDSAALGIHSIFTSYQEWLFFTIKFLLDSTKSTITIRQHPHERYPLVKSNDDFQHAIFEKFQNNSRINFVDCFSKINTYKLIYNSDFVVCFSSTAGVEAALFNKQVIVASNCYYSNFKFVSKPNTIDMYKYLITNAVINIGTYNNIAINDTYLCHILGQSCNLIITDFTPVLSDYYKWIKLPPIQIYNSNKVQKYLDSIDKGIPMCYFNFLDNISI